MISQTPNSITHKTKRDERSHNRHAIVTRHPTLKNPNLTAQLQYQKTNFNSKERMQLKYSDI